ncbi:MAG: peptidase family protein [Candidatus Eremiobacteraeota bacterium]|nr:peptidase family protein [Candidatus Eremiobacteraeota bacterium]
MSNQLSPHFTLQEFTDSDTARQLGLSNLPSADMLVRLKETAAQLEAVRALLGDLPISINSAYRSPAVNSAVGGVPSSAHQQAFAVDFTCASFGTPFDVCKKIAGSPLKFDQLIHEKRVWVHISFAPTMRQQLLTLPPAGGDYVSGILP